MEPDLAAEPTGGQTNPGQGVDRPEVGLDIAHIEVDHVRTDAIERGPDAVAQRARVRTVDRAADDEMDRTDQVLTSFRASTYRPSAGAEVIGTLQATDELRRAWRSNL